MNTHPFPRQSPARWLRREPWERATAALIGLGLVMLMQPWSIDIYSHAFTVLLAGVAGYSIAGKMKPTPEAPSAPPPQGGATSGPAKPVPRPPANEPVAAHAEHGHE